MLTQKLYQVEKIEDLNDSDCKSKSISVIREINNILSNIKNVSEDEVIKIISTLRILNKTDYIFFATIFDSVIKDFLECLSSSNIKISLNALTLVNEIFEIVQIQFIENWIICLIGKITDILNYCNQKHNEAEFSLLRKLAVDTLKKISVGAYTPITIESFIFMLLKNITTDSTQSLLDCTILSINNFDTLNFFSILHLTVLLDNIITLNEEGELGKQYANIILNSFTNILTVEQLEETYECLADLGYQYKDNSLFKMN